MSKKKTANVTKGTLRPGELPGGETPSERLGALVDAARASIIKARSEFLLERDLEGVADDAMTLRFREDTAGAVVALDAALSQLGIAPGSTL